MRSSHQVWHVVVSLWGSPWSRSLLSLSACLSIGGAVGWRRWHWNNKKHTWSSQHCSFFPGESKACVADRGWNYPHPPSPGKQTGLGRVYGGPGVLGKEAAAVPWSSSNVMSGQLSHSVHWDVPSLGELTDWFKVLKGALCKNFGQKEFKTQLKSSIGLTFWHLCFVLQSMLNMLTREPVPSQSECPVLAVWTLLWCFGLLVQAASWANLQ